MHFSFLRTFIGEIVFFIAGNTGYIKAFGISDAGFTIYIDHIVSGTLVVLLKNGYVYDVLTNKGFVRHLHYFHFTGTGKRDDIIERRTIHYKFILLQPAANKTIGPVHKQFSVCDGYLFGLNG